MATAFLLVDHDSVSVDDDFVTVAVNLIDFPFFTLFEEGSFILVAFTSLATTTTFIFAFFPEVVLHVIVAVPFFFAITLPVLAFTVATDFLFELQVTRSVVFAGPIVADKV